jgi:hypothetical protein
MKLATHLPQILGSNCCRVIGLVLRRRRHLVCTAYTHHAVYDVHMSRGIVDE